MKIRIASDEHRFNITLPNGLLLNSVTAGMAAAAVNKYAKGILSYEALRALFLEVRKSGHHFKGMPLVYVHSHDGDEVEIVL